MTGVVQISVNIAIEGTMAVLLSVLMLTCLGQKKRSMMTTPFAYILIFGILANIEHIVIWSMIILHVCYEYGAVPLRILYILDYVFGCIICVAFYYYIEDLVKRRYRNDGITYNSPRYIHKFLILWGITTSLLYSVAIFIPSIYRVDMGNEIYSVAAFVCMHIAVKLAGIFSLILISRHRNIIGIHDTLLCLCFVLAVSVFSVTDEIFGMCVSHVLISLLAFVLYVRIDLYKGLMLERQGKEIAEWKTQIMLSQMQPHFLYNVLTVISSMCDMQNATQARDVVNRFADYLRANLDSLGKERTVPFEKELEHIKTYMWLEKVRFEDMINISYDIAVTDFAVPSLSVQPIVENAIKHGILPKEEPGTIVLRTFETMSDYTIVVEDDGVGFDVKESLNDSRVHVGIENVSKRLELICNGECTINSEKGKGTVVTIHIPKGDKL